jgi:hypothetical protein
MLSNREDRWQGLTSQWMDATKCRRRQATGRRAHWKTTMMMVVNEQVGLMHMHMSHKEQVAQVVK